MKIKIFTTALLLALALNSYAQDQKLLEVTTKKMIDITRHENPADILGTIYPGVFKLISKEDYVSQQRKILNGSDYKIHVEKTDPSIDYGTIKKADDANFCLVNYNQMMTVELQNKLAPNEIAAKEDYFKKLLGTEHVHYLEESNTINVKKRIRLLAIADKLSNNQWTFVDPNTPRIELILKDQMLYEIDPETYSTKNPALKSQEQSETIPENIAPEDQQKYLEAKKASDAKKKAARKKS